MQNEAAHLLKPLPFEQSKDEKADETDGGHAPSSLLIGSDSPVQIGATANGRNVKDSNSHISHFNQSFKFPMNVENSAENAGSSEKGLQLTAQSSTQPFMNQAINQHQLGFPNPMQVPLNGPLKSTPIIMHQQQMSILNHPHLKGMCGQLLQVPLSKKMQRA